MRYWRLAGAATALLCAGVVHTAPIPLEETVEEVWTPKIPTPLAGPYVVDPAILADFDGPGADCAAANHLLSFNCLIYRDGRSGMKANKISTNPFNNVEVFDEVRATITRDLASIRKHPEFGGAKVQSLPTDFLTFDGATIELVGVINRMDRQFNRDIVPEHHKRLACGEISAIYRFGYNGTLAPGTPSERRYGSRLPVTMNVVFSAQPWSKASTCQEVAKHWLDYSEAMQAGVSTDALRAKAAVAISSLRPEDIDRIELNMQGSRVSASDDDASRDYKPAPPGTDFGTQATYIIRVFRWDKVDRTNGHWHPSYLTNQIDRARLLGNRDGDENTCNEDKGTKINRTELAAYLFSMGNSKANPDALNAFGDIDNGILNIPQKFLACRAISVSPGGSARSGNQPFWNTSDSVQAIISDVEIDAALARYRRRYPNALAFVGTADEVRTRLNDASCSGCHQSRAIAGFHFPGSDVAGTSPVNAVYLPGSPHFFGDQARRMDILRKIAAGGDPQGSSLATSYALRPFSRYAALAPDAAADPAKRIQLIGGWGGACMIARPSGSVRKWGCASGLECQPVFKSANQPRIGVCLNPTDHPQLGDAMQFGEVRSQAFGLDRYFRQPAALSMPGQPRNTTIDTSWLKPPAQNSLLAAHQEYYQGLGKPSGSETDFERARRVRDQGTGGFPGGSLRLSECQNLPGEATCALLASSGFNACLDEVKAHLRTPESCFRSFTNYSGVRACDPANPCRDDYICLGPMRYLRGNYKDKMSARRDARKAEYEASAKFHDALNQTYFGEAGPDDTWLDRNDGRGDRRGVCIPPYFVFQFKADGHVVPTKRER
jgi:hypothetical protein